MNEIDKLVILKTDTIPYEVPLIYNNNVLVNYIRAHMNTWNDINCNCWDNIKSTVSYNFKIYKNKYEDRNMNLCHPLGQLYMLKFLEQYDKDIINQMKIDFKKDLENSEILDKNKYEDRSMISKVKESISRLFSPIL